MKLTKSTTLIIASLLVLLANDAIILAVIGKRLGAPATFIDYEQPTKEAKNAWEIVCDDSGDTRRWAFRSWDGKIHTTYDDKLSALTAADDEKRGVDIRNRNVVELDRLNRKIWKRCETTETSP
jgi:hypothetical protein